MNAHAPIRAGAPVAPLRRDLPLLHIDGRIKFRAVLRIARGERRLRREDDATPRFGASCYLRRFDRVRFDMARVRERIAHDRAFWSVANLPTQLVRQNPEDAWDFAWSRKTP